MKSNHFATPSLARNIARPFSLTEAQTLSDADRIRQTTGQPLSANALDLPLLLAIDLPGLSVAGKLVPGAADNETTLVLQTTDEPFIYGDVGLDNTGARSTGTDGDGMRKLNRLWLTASMPF